nr:hypothetical protein [Streptomyces rishiriensis]
MPHQQDTDHVRCALRNLLAESPALIGRTHCAQQSYWYCTPAGLAEAAASAELPSTAGRTTGKRIAASKTGLREHGLALVDTVIAFHQAEMADHADWQVDVAQGAGGPGDVCAEETWGECRLCAYNCFQSESQAVRQTDTGPRSKR